MACSIARGPISGPQNPHNHNHQNHQNQRFSKGPVADCPVNCSFIPKTFWGYAADKGPTLLADGIIPEEEHTKLQFICQQKIEQQTSFEDRVRNDRLQTSTPAATSTPQQSNLNRSYSVPYPQHPAYSHPLGAFSPRPQFIQSPAYYPTQIPQWHSQYPSYPTYPSYPSYPSYPIHTSPWHQGRVIIRYPTSPSWPPQPQYPTQRPQSHPYPYPQPIPYPQPVPHPQAPQNHPQPQPPKPAPTTPRPVPTPQPAPQPAPQTPKASSGEATINIFDCNGGKNTNAARQVDLANPPKDVHQQVTNIVSTIRRIHTFALSTFGRNSWDGRGSAYNNYIRYDRNMFNAFWDGKQMVYGAPTDKLDDNDHPVDMTDPGVIAHEAAHAVNSFKYQGDSGAFEESKADIAALIDDHLAKGITKPREASEDAWMLGDLIMHDLPGGKKQCMRRADRPGTASEYDIQELANKNGRPHIDAVRKNANNRHVIDDHGGVHVFSSLSTHVFYLTAIAFEEPIYGRLAKLWNGVCSDPTLSKEANWQTIADATVSNARKMGFNDLADKLVENWNIVGIRINERRQLAPQTFFVQQLSPFHQSPVFDRYGQRVYV